MDSVLIDAKDFLAMAKALEEAAATATAETRSTMSLSAVQVSMSDEGLRLVATDGYRLVRYETKGRKYGNYPDVTHVIPKVETAFFAVQLEVSEVKAALKAIGKPKRGDRSLGLRITFANGKASFAAEYTTVTSSARMLAVDSHCLPEDFTLLVKPEQFLACLDAVQSESLFTIYLDADNQKAVLFRGNTDLSHDVVLMPLRF